MTWGRYKLRTNLLVLVPSKNGNIRKYLTYSVHFPSINIYKAEEYLTHEFVGVCK